MEPEIEVLNNRTQNTDVDLIGRGLARLTGAMQAMGFTSLREGQDRAVMSILGGQDTICVLPTSLGKSACYIIPALAHDWRLLVFSPLKSLMRDQVRSLQSKGICALAINSDTKETENLRAISDWVRGDCKILYVAPERLRNETFLRAMQQAPPDFIATDEAHVISSWSDNFRHSYTYIGELVERFKPKVVAAFTATMPKKVEADVRRVLRMPDAVKIFHFPIRENLKLSSGNIDNYNDLNIRVRDTKGKILVYCGSRKLTEETANSLSRALKAEVGFYHSEVSESTKKMYQDQFYDGRIRVICATNAFGMGVDIPDIRSVIHLRHPGDPEALSQEVGRAGRDGLDSYCHTYEGRDSLRLNQDFIRQGYPSEDQFEKVFSFMRKRADASGIFHMTGKELEEGSGVYLNYHMAIMQTLYGSRVLEDVSDTVRIHKIRFIGQSDIGRFIQLEAAVWKIAAQDGEWLLFDLDVLAQAMDVGRPTIQKYLKSWQAENLIEYEAPPSGKAKRVVGDLSLVDFDRLAQKRTMAYQKLDYVLGYFTTPDEDKAAYLQHYFLNL